MRRVLATLPVDDLAALPLPDLRCGLEAVSAAYGARTLQRGQPGSAWFRVAIGGVQLWRYRNALLAGLLVAVVLALATWIWSRHRAHSS